MNNSGLGSFNRVDAILSRLSLRECVLPSLLLHFLFFFWLYHTLTSAIFISITPPLVTLTPGATQKFIAQVSGGRKPAGTPTTSSDVKFKIQESDGGAITPMGEYTAPTRLGTYHVMVSSAADPKVVAVATVNVAPVGITLNPSSVSLGANESQLFIATVTNTSNTSVTFHVQEPEGGLITVGGFYKAPIKAGTYHVVAVSNAYPAAKAAATITVTPRLRLSQVSQPQYKIRVVMIPPDKPAVQKPLPRPLPRPRVRTRPRVLRAPRPLPRPRPHPRPLPRPKPQPKPRPQPTLKLPVITPKPAPQAKPAPTPKKPSTSPRPVKKPVPRPAPKPVQHPLDPKSALQTLAHLKITKDAEPTFHPAPILDTHQTPDERQEIRSPGVHLKDGMRLDRATPIREKARPSFGVPMTRLPTHLPERTNGEGNSHNLAEAGPAMARLSPTQGLGDNPEPTFHSGGGKTGLPGDHSPALGEGGSPGGALSRANTPDAAGTEPGDRAGFRGKGRPGPTPGLTGLPTNLPSHPGTPSRSPGQGGSGPLIARLGQGTGSGSEATPTFGGGGVMTAVGGAPTAHEGAGGGSGFRGAMGGDGSGYLAGGGGPSGAGGSGGKGRPGGGIFFGGTGGGGTGGATAGAGTGGGRGHGRGGGGGPGLGRGGNPGGGPGGGANGGDIGGLGGRIGGGLVPGAPGGDGSNGGGGGAGIGNSPGSGFGSGPPGTLGNGTPDGLGDGGGGGRQGRFRPGGGGPGGLPGGTGGGGALPGPNSPGDILADTIREVGCVLTNQQPAFNAAKWHDHSMTALLNYIRHNTHVEVETPEEDPDTYVNLLDHDINQVRDFTYEDIRRYPMIFLTGDRDFTLSQGERAALRKYVLEDGGTIYGEDCHDPYGHGLRGGFDAPFKQYMTEIFGRPWVVLPLSMRDNGTLNVYNIAFRIDQIPEGDNHDRDPFQAMMMNGRAAVIYTINDYGDVWSTHTGPMWRHKPEYYPASLREPAYRIGANLYLYAALNFAEFHKQRARVPVQ